MGSRNFVRVAVECGLSSVIAILSTQGQTDHIKGHGTLHAIYAAVEESRRIKGWDAVDLLIIGGDFQVGIH